MRCLECLPTRSRTINYSFNFTSSSLTQTIESTLVAVMLHLYWFVVYKLSIALYLRSKLSSKLNIALISALWAHQMTAGAVWLDLFLMRMRPSHELFMSVPEVASTCQVTVGISASSLLVPMCTYIYVHPYEALELIHIRRLSWNYITIVAMQKLSRLIIPMVCANKVTCLT